jgi:hypothetical protein
MMIYTCPLSTANYHIGLWHRHSGMVTGALFCLAAYKRNVLVGVATIGRPVARALDDGQTWEVTRVATDGTRNACSALYADARRRARHAGIVRLVTYTREGESGASLRALGIAAPVRLPKRSETGWQTRGNRKTGGRAAFRWELL